jgi:hypothetical protein
VTRDRDFKDNATGSEFLPGLRAGRSLLFGSEPLNKERGAMADGDVQLSTDASGWEGLRRCEDLFFGLEFAELEEQASSLIEQDPERGDAYAFRSFARLGESRYGGAKGRTFGLVELLRDYFRACDRPMATEGGGVCRLLLKLVFADLARKIKRARPGEKFSLDKNDPLCGGALSILEGEFDAAEASFGAAIADPVSRALAYAGIGLLKMFHSDRAGALSALAQAGSEDEDVRMLVHSLE